MRKIATVTADGMYLREGPSPDAEWIDKLARGDQLEVTEQKGAWFKGTVIKIVSEKYVEDRVGKSVWFHENGVTITMELPPDPLPTNGWAPYVALAVVIIICGVLVYSCTPRF